MTRDLNNIHQQDCIWISSPKSSLHSQVLLNKLPPPLSASATIAAKPPITSDTIFEHNQLTSHITTPPTSAPHVLKPSPSLLSLHPRSTSSTETSNQKMSSSHQTAQSNSETTAWQYWTPAAAALCYSSAATDATASAVAAMACGCTTPTAVAVTPVSAVAAAAAS